ncbi:MAG: J domain-containing protein [Thermoguttaceae bacterium]|jgi:DnaJ-class molecular chaperone
MAADYYKTLGISRNASHADIQKAYRELARKHHPDMNPDKPEAVKKFQEIQAAFDVLNNPEKREMYDRYGSSFETMGQGAPQSPGWGAGPGGVNAEDIDFGQFFGERFGQGGEGLGDIFSHFRRAAGRGGGGGSSKRRGSDASSEVTIPFATAISGGEIQLSLRRQSGETETIVVKIPPGIEDGKKMRLRGKGEPASGRGTVGDLMLTVRVAPHPFFARRGNDLLVRLPVTLGEAVGGASVDVPTPSGTVSVHIPPGTSSGKKLRIKGHGVAPKSGAKGDLLAEVLIVLPTNLTEADRETIRQIDGRYPTNPRQNLRW